MHEQNEFLIISYIISQALLDDKELIKMVLLDHIPHNDATNPDENNESSYAPYRMSVYIPDVNCPKCVLQLLYPMTDKSTKCGVQTCFYNPDDTACKGSTSASTPTCSGAPNDSLCHTENECFSNCKLLLLVLFLCLSFFRLECIVSMENDYLHELVSIKSCLHDFMHLP